MSSRRCNRFVALLLDDEMFFSLLFEVVFTKVKRVQTDVRFEVVHTARCVDLFVFLHDAAEATESCDNTEFKKNQHVKDYVDQRFPVFWLPSSSKEQLIDANCLKQSSKVFQDKNVKNFHTRLLLLTRTGSDTVAAVRAAIFHVLLLLLQRGR